MLERLIAAPGDSTDVKLLEDSTATDPFAGPTTAPAIADAGADAITPADADAGETAPTSQPSEGRSVSSSEVSVNDAGTVEIHVNDANLVEVLRMLSLQSQKNIVATKDVHGTVTANLYDVTVREALDAILHANGYAYRERGNFIYVYTAKEIAEIEKSERRMSTEVFRVFYTPAANAANMIKPVLSKAGGEVAITTQAKAGINSSPGGGAGNDHASDEVIVVTDYPENIDAARKILAEIDKRPQQILLEATILRATLNEDNALGVDFNILGGVDFSTVGSTIPGGQITNATPGTASPADRPHSAGSGNSFSSAVPNGGLKVGFVSQSVSVFLSALEQTTDTTILANPKVLALNRQQGEVFVGNEDGYYTTLTTETTTSQSVESLKTGTRLLFRPFIAADGFIRMEVHPEDSNGQVNANGLPSKSTTEVTSNVMVKDGHTIVIGGLFRETTVSGRSQVPFLGNLPVAGLLFRNQRDRTVREEVIILLTPHIIKDDVSYSRLSEEELKRGEALRVGVRKGMMPWGRERLAEGWYEAARKELAKPHPDRSVARWHLDCATNLNPKFIEAIELKQQLTGREVTTVDGSTIRNFVRRSIISDVAIAAPATQPSVDATPESPSTQPSVAAADPATTQPAEALTEVPATQPAEETTVEVDPEEMTEATIEPAPEAVSVEGSSTSEEVAETDAPTGEVETVEVETIEVPMIEESAEALSDESGSESASESAPSNEDQTSVTVTPLEEQSQ
ncbi:MAG: secretin and TonB N-terminal domain-containing protein [Tepidisphaeraceae bacterium]